MNRRKFMTGLLGVAVVTPLVTKSLGDRVFSDSALERAIDAKTHGMSMYEANAYRAGWRGRKYDMIIVDDPYSHETDSYLYGTGQTARERQRDLLAKWYGSKVDDEVFKHFSGAYHG